MSSGGAWWLDSSNSANVAFLEVAGTSTAIASTSYSIGSFGLYVPPAPGYNPVIAGRSVMIAAMNPALSTWTNATSYGTFAIKWSQGSLLSFKSSASTLAMAFATVLGAAVMLM
jgi:hypothetical protein